MSTAKASSTRPFIYGEQRNGRNRLYISGVPLPVAPWWVFACSLTLLPLALLGVVLWAAGAVLLYQARNARVKPKDARAFDWLGRKLLVIFWLPQRLWFGWRDPDQLRRTRQALSLLRPVAVSAARRGMRRTSGKGDKVGKGES